MKIKKAIDRESVIEDALESFEWLFRISLWLAFSLTGWSFLFWAEIGSRPQASLSFLGLSLLLIPLQSKKAYVDFIRGSLGMIALVMHLLIVKETLLSLPAVLVIVPVVLASEIYRGVVAKVLFATVLWAFHSYWLLGEWVHPRQSLISWAGAAISLALIALFSVLKRQGKVTAVTKLKALKGTNDFDQQRIHASRLQILGELSAALVHELSNPLTNLGGFFMQLFDIEELRSNIRWKEISSRIEANMQRMRDLLNGYRSFAKPQTQEKLEFNLKELFTEVDLLASHAFKSKQVSLSIEAKNSNEYLIIGNRVEIGQVVMNFLLNALFAVGESKTRHVRVGFEYDAEGGILFVEDSGPGVSDEMKERVFKPFYTTKGEDGSGLGLYISKIIADNHESKILVKESSLKGARFELVFPSHRFQRDSQKLKDVA